MSEAAERAEAPAATTGPERPRWLEAAALPVALFLCSFGWGFVYVGIPFHAQALSTLGPAATLAWTGWILGVTSLVSVWTTPLWARHVERIGVRQACALVPVLQGAGFVGAALAHTLPQLFLARLLLGAVGSMSTFAFLLAGRAPSPTEVRRQLAAVQAAMTVAQVVAPLAGAFAAGWLGVRISFGLGALVLVASGAVVWWGMVDTPSAARAAGARHRVSPRELTVVTVLVVAGTLQESFLAAVLPQVLAGLGVGPTGALEAGGVLVFASGAAAALGAIATPRLAEFLPERRLLPLVLASSSISLAFFAVPRSVWGYTALRFVQSLCIAPLFPLVVGRMARRKSDSAIGIVNSARVGGYFLGPVVATSVLAWGPPVLLYSLLALAGLFCVPLIERRRSHRTHAGD